MTKVFLTADNHFFHKNIIRYCNRPFKTVEEMNKEMINKWNDVVGKDDVVIHLGDFSFRGRAREIREQLNGAIILIKGNHDYSLKEEDGFIIADGNLMIKNLILSHRPLLKSEIPKGYVNVFGHIHNNTAYSGICICVEQTDYKPVELKNIFLLSLAFCNNRSNCQTTQQL